ncbi:c-type cytochrome [Pandoraea apista]|uniref:Cytochrome c5 family protein n=1 Tax=Pandoraea apista TaxID=93218 RepID=A0ABX9ZNV1_9BURK|nr:c-type cytochrome [Pandoraea apista]PTD99683.1 cytochrome c5 family protein [Pandoraea apista]RRJ31113.1 cytochrome c5 family protein [Pandoraea apista]RRJ81369.1 cytochrome c5 family protein [Pandoraea apista]RSD11210.1 cytochrome c5 family protein [Pandoraea apista]RSD15617.1 cytochrome c5 family protein [Pandoraea apista]
MSEAHNEHESLIKTPKQLIAAVIAGFLVPIVIIVLLVNYVGNNALTGAGSSAMTEQAIAERIAPVAKVEVKDASAPRVYQTGEQLYKAVCAACHAAGTAGAPKVGSADWAPRIAQGYDEMLKIALAGKGAMPPRGGTSPDDVTDYEIGRAIVYMANASGGKLQEPAEPAQPASGAAAAPASGAPAAASGADAGSAAAAAAAMASLKTAAPTVAGAGSNLDAGKKLYDTVCMACHASGVMNAPKFGDKAAWAPRIATGIDTLHNAAIKGLNAMPPKGGAANASDDDVKAAVDYMVNAVK